MSSPVYLDFLGTVWSSLPEEDQARLGELWQGFEQVFGAVYQKYLEDSVNIVQQDLLPFSTERWLNYTFDSTNFLNEPATYTSNQDLSQGINLQSRYLLNISVDSAPPIEVDCRGLNPALTTVPEIIHAINSAFHFSLAKAAVSNALVQLVSPTSGAASRITVYPASIAAADAAEYILGLEATRLPRTFPDFPLLYQSPYPLLASIPEFQDFVRDESVTQLLLEGADYVIQPGSIIAFKTRPPASMWARRSLFDQENPWNNYGFLIDVYQKNSARYASVIQGLWYAFWNGPTPDNVLRSLYLLVGLPTAKEASTVTAVSTTSIETTSPAGLRRVFQVPSGLVPIVTVGQKAVLFDPLVSGISVFDRENKPGFVASEITRTGIQRFLTDDATRGPGDTDETKALTLLEEYLFLPQISVDAFINADVNLGNIRIFLNAIKPLNKTYVFQITSGNILEPLGLTERTSSRYDIDLTENVEINQTSNLLAADLLAYETVENYGLNLDPNGVLFQETLTIDVYSFGSLIDSISA